MTTVGTIIEQVRGEILGQRREELDILNGNINDSVTSLTSTDATAGLLAKARIEIDLEEMYVRSVSGTTVTVLRGQFGSTAASHTSGAVITINPKFSRFRILRAINDELRSLSSPENGLFKISEQNITFVAGTYAYNLASATDVIGSTARVNYKVPGSEKLWPEAEVEILRGMDTSEFASGFAVKVPEGAYPGQPMRVRYRTKFTSLTTTSQDITTDGGLPDSCADILVLGAMARLVIPSEINRNFTDARSDPRADNDVPAGARANSGRAMLMLREERIKEEATRLRAAWPTRR